MTNNLKPYKLPKHWLGRKMVVPVIEEGRIYGSTRKVTESDINPDCHCVHPMASHLCMEGHMLQCHAGMTCQQAGCSHYNGSLEEG